MFGAKKLHHLNIKDCHPDIFRLLRVAVIKINHPQGVIFTNKE